jgi:biotin carboxyl carrier protein
MSELLSPLPGYVAKIHVSAGSAVKSGDPVITLQSMKMEIDVPAGADGVIDQIHVSEGDEVESGALVATFS